MRGEPDCKLFGNCTEPPEKCNKGCDYYNPTDPEEAAAVEEGAIKRASYLDGVTAVPSDIEKFDKKKEFMLFKRHIFQIQAVSPKKLTLKYKRRADNANLPDGVYVFKDENGETLEDAFKVFSDFDKSKMG